MPSREPVRTCVGCRQEAGKRALVRLVHAPDGAVRLDLTGRAHGRGAYLHRESGCIDLARRRRALERSLKATVSEEVWQEVRQEVRMDLTAEGVSD
jgi:predicted RNA-binding protein YlxR (DUF448 family)